MHARIVVVVVAILVGLPAWAVAQDAEALRREIEQMRQQMQNAQREYQKALDVLTERLQRLESRPQQAATAPVVVQAPPGPAPAPPSVTDLARPRQPFSLYGERRQGQFLLDFGVVGDFVGNITQRNVEKATGGTFAGRENRFFPREIELNLFGQIDPYARGEVRIEAAEEFEDGERELHLGLAEAHLTLLTLPFGTQAKLGLMRNRFGLLNERHREALPQTDQPSVLTRFLGEEGLRESGARAGASAGTRTARSSRGGGGSVACATTGRSFRWIRAASGRWSPTSRSCPRSSCASAWPTSTPTARTA